MDFCPHGNAGVRCCVARSSSTINLCVIQPGRSCCAIARNGDCHRECEDWRLPAGCDEVRPYREAGRGGFRFRCRAAGVIRRIPASDDNLDHGNAPSDLIMNLATKVIHRRGAVAEGARLLDCGRPLPHRMCSFVSLPEQPSLCKQCF